MHIAFLKLYSSYNAEDICDESNHINYEINLNEKCVLYEEMLKMDKIVIDEIDNINKNKTEDKSINIHDDKKCLHIVINAGL